MEKEQSYQQMVLISFTGQSEKSKGVGTEMRPVISHGLRLRREVDCRRHKEALWSDEDIL